MNAITWKDYCFFAGIATGFLLAVALGREAAGHVIPVNFVRFYPAISPESHFYPTYESMEKLALDRWSPGKTLVIVGGNSVFNGVGQQVENLWSRRLQELLGPSYVVVNLAFRGAVSTEGAALVAEALQNRGIPLIYVANSDAGTCGLPVGRIYEYLYWQAVATGKVSEYAQRDAMFALLQSPWAWEKSREMQRAARLNHWMHFQDLWNYVSYHRVFTVWNSLTLRTSRSPWAPRIESVDRESAPEPLAQRFLANNDQEMAIVRSSTESLLVRDRFGHWQKKKQLWDLFEKIVAGSFVPALRSRVLMVVSPDCPYYRDQLTPEELARDEAAYRLTAAVWSKHGIRCMVSGRGFSAEDYRDRRHLSASGGAKLAQQVAAEILTMRTSTHE